MGPVTSGSTPGRIKGDPRRLPPLGPLDGMAAVAVVERNIVVAVACIPVGGTVVAASIPVGETAVGIVVEAAPVDAGIVLVV